MHSVFALRNFISFNILKKKKDISHVVIQHIHPFRQWYIFSGPNHQRAYQICIFPNDNVHKLLTENKSAV